VQDGNSKRLVTPEELSRGEVVRWRPDSAFQEVERLPLDPSAAKKASSEHSETLHPAQLYSSFNSFLITALLVAFFTLRPNPGRVMALMLVLEGATRFLLEMVRAEPPVYPPLFGTMSLSMVLGIVLVIGGAVMWFIFRAPSDNLSPATLAPA
jgi:prolipoprotein diacylglyceryltransferase